MRKLLEFLVVVGALKALIPTPGHVFEFGEFALAAVLACLAFVLIGLYNGEKARKATSGHEAQTRANSPLASDR